MFEKKKAFIFGCVSLIAVGSIGATVFAESNPVGSIKKNVLMSELSNNKSNPLSEEEKIIAKDSEEKWKALSEEEKMAIKLEGNELQIDEKVPVQQNLEYVSPQVPVKRIVPIEDGESLSYEMLVQLAKEEVKGKFGVDLDNEKYDKYMNEEDVISSVESRGAAKMSWFINGLEKPTSIYVVMITGKGKVLECIKTK